MTNVGWISSRNVGRLTSGAALALTFTFGSALPVAAQEETYTVQPRDTLSHIAVRTGASVTALVDANGLKNADRIWAGMVLVIPGESASSAGQPTGGYTVAAGDTLSEIAARFGTSSRVLAELNGLSNIHSIRAGFVLQVPAGTEVTTSGTNSYPSLPDRITSRPERLALVPTFEKWAAANNIEVDLLMAIAWQESGWNNEAVSHKGAVGIGQIMPATGEWIATSLIGDPSLDANKPEDNIRMSARFVSWLLDYTDGDERLAIASYYQGPGSVRQGELYGSTEQYIENVNIHRQFFVSAP